MTQNQHILDVSDILKRCSAWNVERPEHQEHALDETANPSQPQSSNKSMETLGGRRGTAKGRRRDVTRSCLGSSGFSL